MSGNQEMDSQISTTAFEWLVELQDHSDTPHHARAAHESVLRDFAQWFLRSRTHQEAFVEAMAISGYLRRLRPQLFNTTPISVLEEKLVKFPT